MDNKLQPSQGHQNKEQNNQNQQQKNKSSNPLEELNKVGGYNFVESVVDGIANMNPTRKARKEIFLNEQNKKTEREDL